MSATPSHALLDEIDAMLPPRATDAEVLARVLDAVLRHFNCVTGTIHRLDSASGLLALCAARGIPAAILERVRSIPIGKGMAGLAAQQRECVQVCNLQTDASGAAKPGAKLTEMAGSIAAPMLVEGELLGTIGIAKPSEYEFTADERALLLEAGMRIARRMWSNTP